MKALTPIERRASSRFSLEQSARGISRLPFLLLSFLAVQSIIAQEPATRVETFTLPIGGTVRIENARGATQVRAWDARTVRVIAEKKGDGSARIDPSELVLMSAGNMVVVDCKQSNRGGRIDVTAYVPRQCRVEITGGSSAVDVSGSLSGALIQTTTGNIGYAVPQLDDAQVSMHSTRGNVRSAIPLKAMDRSGSHWLQGTLGQGKGQIVLNSEAGNINLMAADHSTHSAAAKNDVRSLVVNAAPGSADAMPASRTASGTADSDIDSFKSASSSTKSSGRDKSKDKGSYDSGAVNIPDDLSQPNPNSMALGGGKRKSNSASETKGGPFERDQKQDSNSEDGMGLSVRIIPSGVSRREDTHHPSPSSQGVDYTKYTYDSDGNLRPVPRNPPSQATDIERTQDTDHDSPPRPSYQNAPDYPDRQGASTSLGGNKRNANSASSTKGGPFERDQKQSGYDDDSMGLSVKILPPNSRSGKSADRQSQSRTIYDADDSANNPRAKSSRDEIDSDKSLPARNASPSSTDPRNGTADADDPPSIARAGEPPSLKRERPARSSEPESSAASRPADSGSDEAPLVLESALVNLNVSVTDRSGKAFGSLKREDFRVFENNEPQTVEFFASSNTPFNLVLLLDLSGSIHDKLNIVKAAALHFLDVIGPNDKVAVLTFTRTVRVISPLTNDRESLRSRIKNIDVAEGGTALYEALWFAMSNTLRGTQGQRNAIVVMTDGVDNSLQQERRLYLPSRVPYKRLMQRMEESDILVFPVYLDTEEEEVFERMNGSTQDYEMARMQLNEMAEETGSQMFVAKEARDLAGVYNQVAAALRTVYSVGYYPTHPERDGSYRRVRVASTKPDALVKARKGYYAR